MFHYVLDCSRLFQVVQLSCFSWFWRLFETVLGCYTLIFGCFECFRFFRAVLDCLGHRGSTKPFKLCSAALVRCVFEFVLVVFYVVIDRLKLLQLVSRSFRMAMFVLGCLKLFTLCLGCSRWVSSGLRCCSLF